MFVPELDRWISEEFSRLAEIIQDYDPYLELRWIPPEHRTDPEDKKNPYCIWDTRTNYVVMFASELDSPVAILAKLFDIDNKNGDVNKRLQAHNAAQQAMQMREWLDEREAAKDFSAFVFSNKKNYWTHEGRKRDDEFRDLGSVRKVIDGHSGVG
jgi:hypothetical protein